MLRVLFLLLAISWTCPGVDKTVMRKLLELARSQSDVEVFRTELKSILGAERIQRGTAWAGNGPDFLWAVESNSTPMMHIDGQLADGMRRSKGSRIWFRTGTLTVGDAHRFHYVINGTDFGGDLNVPAYTPDSYQQAGFPRGRSPRSCPM